MPNGDDEREARLYPWGREPTGLTAPFPTGPYMRYPQTREEYMATERSDPSKMPTIAPPEGMKWEWSEWSPEGQYTGGQWELVSTDEMDLLPSEQIARERLEFDIRRWEEEMRRADQAGDMTAFQQAQLELQRLQLGLEERRLGAEEFGEVRDWIKRWKMMQPPQAQERLRRGEVARREWMGGSPEERRAIMEISGFRPETEMAMEKGVYPYRPGTESAQERIETMLPKERFPVTETTWRQIDPETQEEIITKVKAKIERGEERGRVPSAPPTPGWMPQFVPGQIAGQTMERLPVKTPSGQQWGKTPWSVREGLAGYMDWRGGRGYRDMLEQMAMMQPRTPTKPRGWQPAIRR